MLQRQLGTSTVEVSEMTFTVDMRDELKDEEGITKLRDDSRTETSPDLVACTGETCLRKKITLELRAEKLPHQREMPIPKHPKSLCRSFPARSHWKLTKKLGKDLGGLPQKIKRCRYP